MIPSFTSRDLFAEIDQLQRAVNQSFGSTSASIRGLARGFPAVNVGSTPSSVEIYVFAPGLDPAKVEVDLDRLVLTIAGERAGRTDKPDAKTNVHLNERFAGRFRRVVTLPEDIDPDSVEAVYRDGVLQISVKRQEAVKPRRINVQ